MIWRQKIGLRLILFLALVPVASRAQQNYSLLLVEFGKDSSGQQTQSLVRYRFAGGVLAAKDNVLTRKTFDLRFDLGANQIYQNRYVISDQGDVVDLATRQLLFKSEGRLAGIDKNSGSVIIRVEQTDGPRIYAFDLASHDYRRLEQPGVWASKGILSPSGKLAASGDVDSIWLLHPDGKKALLGTGFSRSGSFHCSDTTRPTFVWVDDNRLLTQRGNGELVMVGTTGKVEPFMTIFGVDPAICGPVLTHDLENQIVYDDRRQAWLIDVAKRTAQPYSWYAEGHGFELAYQRNDQYGRAIRYQGKEIGRWWCNPGTLTRTAPGRIAVAYGAVGSNLGYPEGVKVWSAETGAWTTIKPAWLTAIIGWVEE